MPWRKYPTIEGMYGPIFKLSKGIKVRRDWRRRWIVDINVKGERRNRTIGEGREGLVKAIKAAEEIAKRMGSVAPQTRCAAARRAPEASVHRLRKGMVPG